MSEHMEDEAERLASFDTWPVWAVKRPTNLAGNGFYYTGIADAVRCFSCGGEIENWSVDDDVSEEHMKRFPTCPFIRGTVKDKKLNDESMITKSTRDLIDTETDPDVHDGFSTAEELLKQISSFSNHNHTASFTAPKTKSMSGKAQYVNHNPKQLCCEDYRRQTFAGNWPEDSLISPVELAKAGFYYVGPEDMAEKLKNQSPSERLGVILDKPKHPQYAVEAARLKSFKSWPKTCIAPDELAKAGFFYVGFSDNVKCFFCGGGLHNWEQLDRPWIEHARWFPDCGYMKLCGGEDSIKNVLQQNQSPAQATTVDFTEKKQADTKVSPDQMAAWMNSSDVKTIINMGFPSSLVKNAIQEKVKRTGVYFTTTEELLEAVLQKRDTANAEMKNSRKGHSKKRNKNKKKKRNTYSDAGEANRVASTSLSESNHNEEEEEEEESPEVEEILNLSSTEDEELNELVTLLEKMKKERRCKVCMDGECNVVFLPCGHIVCCPSCAPALRHCPVCRNFIKGSVRAYFP